MKTVIVDERISSEIFRSLLILGFSPILLPKFPALNEAVCSHPDTLFFRDKNEIYTSADYCEYAPYVLSDLQERHPNIKVNFTSDVLLAEYPRDCAFNALLMGNKLFCRQKSISDSVYEHAKKNSYKIVNTNQGYPACTTLALDKGHAITADVGMAKALSSEGIEVTLIRSGHISLPPHEYGFIGGASFVYKDTVYFFGDYTLHPDRSLIEKAIYSVGKKPYSLGTMPLVDLGGALLFE